MELERSGACRLVWVGSCDKKVDNCSGVMTEESARNSSSYSDISTDLIITGDDSPDCANGTKGPVGHCRGLLFHVAHSGGLLYCREDLL